MSNLPRFGTLLRRLFDRRQLDIRELSGLPDLPTGVEEVLNGAEPTSSFLRQISPALGLHSPDLFVIAGMRVPDDLAPVDGQAGWLAGQIASRATQLPPESRRRLLEFVRSLPQVGRPQAPPSPQPYEEYPPGFGGMLMGMLRNRNLALWDSSKVIANLTGGRVYRSPSAFRLMGLGRKEVTPDLLGGISAVLDISYCDLAVLGDINFPAADLGVDSAVDDAAALIWESRRLTIVQTRMVRDRLAGMSQD
jgi:hypothetical protein